MSKLYQYNLCSSSIFIRILLEEKNISFEIIDGDFWSPSEEFLLMNPAGYYPILSKEGSTIVGASIIVEYLEELINQAKMK